MSLRYFSLIPFHATKSKIDVFLSFNHQSFSIAYYLKLTDHSLSWPEGAATRQDNLWQDTCFELFCKTPSGPEYVEFNFSPSGAWNCYQFDDYRQQMRPLPAPLKISISSILGTWLRATVNWQINGPIAISAITRSKNNPQCNYWALLHPQVRPDFHHPHTFVTIF